MAADRDLVRPLGDPRHRPDPHDSIPLRPVEFEILLVLVGGDAHGWAIIKEAEARVEGGVTLETGTLYRALRRLTGAGMVRRSRERAAADVGDERRRYYAITDFGRAVATAEAERLASLVEAARARALLSCPATTGGLS